MAVVLSVAGVANEKQFERAARLYMGLSWLWPKHYASKPVELKSQAAYEQWLTKNKPSFGASVAGHDSKQPLYWLSGNRHLASFEAVLDFVRPAFQIDAFGPDSKDQTVMHINTSGFATCIWFQRASAVAAVFAELFPARVKLTVHSSVTRDVFKAGIPATHAMLLESAFGEDVIASIKGHTGSPLNWFGETKTDTEFIGGCDALCALLREKASLPAPPPPPPLWDIKAMDDTVTDAEAEKKKYDFDLFVIGGGSGGLACAKEAAILGARVACCDFVSPSAAGTTWGLGGTCVNVGCIPKKLMHTAALLGQAQKDSASFGWETKAGAAAPTHNWAKMVENVQAYIKTLNDGYTNQLSSKKVAYINAKAAFVDPHTVSLTDAKGNVTKQTARRFVIAVGGRPSAPVFPGSDLCITSDDIFSMKQSPGKKVLVVGASYVALECAGFLTGLGYSTTVMVRSVLLRGFDVTCADRIGDYMEHEGTLFEWERVPVRIERIPNDQKAGDAAADAGRLRVTFIPANQEKRYDASKTAADNKAAGIDVQTLVVDTVLTAIGRVASTAALNLPAVGVRVDSATAKIPIMFEQSSVKHIYALGDCAVSCQPGIAPLALELTPVAIQAGRLLARRLFAGAKVQTEYRNVPTTVFTPIEYGAVGYSEEGAFEEFNKENVEVWHAYFQPLEMTLPNRMGDEKTQSYFKLLTLKTDSHRVIGAHVVSPNAGEITQAIAVAIRCKATKDDFDATIGIHPTIAEQMTTLDVTKGSGKSAAKSGC